MPRPALVLVALLVSSRAFAQAATTEDHAPRGSIIGVTVGVPGYERQPATDLVVLGVDVLQAKPSHVGVELAVGTIPRVLSQQTLVAGGRLDAVVPLELTSDFWVTPVAGGSLIGAGGDGGGGAYAGVNAGVGTILWRGHVGVRSSVTWHHFADTRGAIWLAEIGLVGGR